MATIEWLTDTALGTLAKIRDRGNFWHGRVTADGQPDVDLCLDLPPEMSIQDALVIAKQAISFAEENSLALRRAITDELLVSYNTNVKWPDDEPDVSYDQFLQALKLSGITISADGDDFPRICFGFTSDFYAEHQPNVYKYPNSDRLEVILE